MQKSYNPRFIIIDDDPINNTLCRFNIKKILPQSDVHTFNIPEKGFEFILNEYPTDNTEILTILFLDINMPTWTGWDFLSEFAKLDKHIKKQIQIYMLSSSLDPNDIDYAKADKYVNDFIIKPLTNNIILSILEKYQISSKNKINTNKN